jgi:hypothetical protein
MGRSDRDREAKPSPPGRGRTADPPPVSFIVRMRRDDDGHVSGVAERVKSGEKVRFESVEALGPLIARMAAEDDTGRGRAPGDPDSAGP